MNLANAWYSSGMTIDACTANPPARALFSPLTIRGTTLPLRAGVSPMCMYAATDGYVSDFHLAHLGRFALGGAGLVIVEATAIEPRGRISHHDLGLWDDSHVEGMMRIAGFLETHGSVPGIQLGHAGRRASVREPWHAGAPLDATDAQAGTPPWQTVGPSALPAGPDWPVPHELSESEIAESIDQWAAAAQRAATAGFRFIELHGAHGYLLHSFLSPISNTRTDSYGGDAQRRMRYPLEVIRAIREAVPENVILSYRVSSVDGVLEGGLGIEDIVEFSRHAAAAGVDVIDTSSGGISTDRSSDTRVRRGFAFHADFAREIKANTDAIVACVGFIVDPEQASRMIEDEEADIVLLGREMLDNPNWVHHARRSLASDEFDHWDQRFGSALGPRLSSLQRLAESGETPLTRFEAYSGA
ncbi:NADPH dehydrogenase NamA [Paeniglutamicibacter gangotriensis Lz1y]|uniref:NADPH dehydrogenase NamA n=2 Tax=Paeniglutamicibacter gangotriensis TaxID=254787 RepID=M7MYV7_9MICC|nr:NADPH dehydrogenase NamA [Paeniglutamicibacter gangotriensis Lz1y]